jgi:anti-sigma-K factor RskA
MTPADENDVERGGDDLIAAEYVLGVLTAGERQMVARRIEAEPGFARLVDEWEAHFSPMAAAYPDIEPPASVKAGLDRRLFEASPQSSPVRSGLWSSLAFWRGLAAVTVAALALYVAVPYVRPPLETNQNQLVASLASDSSDVRYLALFDARRGEIGLSHVSGERASGHDFELWVIEGKNPPVSVGIIPAGSTAQLKLSPQALAKLASGAVLAISLEPGGGSPTGQPTGPVVAAGDLKTI